MLKQKAITYLAILVVLYYYHIGLEISAYLTIYLSYFVYDYILFALNLFINFWLRNLCVQLFNIISHLRFLICGTANTHKNPLVLLFIEMP